MKYLNEYIIQIAATLLVALAAYVGVQFKNLYKKYVNTEIKEAVCRTAVRFVEQVYLDLHGPEKLAKAMEKASSILAGYGITISEEELVALLEAAVNEFNNAFEKNFTGGNHLPGAPTVGPAIEDPEPVDPPTAAEIIADLKDAE